jgi:hypothetical protein
MMEAASTSERSVYFYQTTRRDNPEDSHFLTFFFRSRSCSTYPDGNNVTSSVLLLAVISLLRVRQNV